MGGRLDRGQGYEQLSSSTKCNQRTSGSPDTVSNAVILTQAHIIGCNTHNICLQGTSAAATAVVAAGCLQGTSAAATAVVAAGYLQEARAATTAVVAAGYLQGASAARTAVVAAGRLQGEYSATLEAMPQGSMLTKQRHNSGARGQKLLCARAPLARHILEASVNG